MPATLLIYDIEHDGLRAKVANVCQDYGLQRIQYSAFAGRLSRTRAEELVLKVRKLAGSRQVDLRLFPVCDRDLQQALVLKQAAPEPDAQPATPPHGAAVTVPPVVVQPVAAVAVVRSGSASRRVELEDDGGNDP